MMEEDLEKHRMTTRFTSKPISMEQIYQEFCKMITSYVANSDSSSFYRIDAWISALRFVEVIDEVQKEMFIDILDKAVYYVGKKKELYSALSNTIKEISDTKNDIQI